MLCHSCNKGGYHGWTPCLCDAGKTTAAATGSLGLQLAAQSTAGRAQQQPLRPVFCHKSYANLTTHCLHDSCTYDTAAACNAVSGAHSADGLLLTVCQPWHWLTCPSLPLRGACCSQLTAEIGYSSPSSSHADHPAQLYLSTVLKPVTGRQCILGVSLVGSQMKHTKALMVKFRMGPGCPGGMRCTCIHNPLRLS